MRMMLYGNLLLRIAISLSVALPSITFAESSELNLDERCKSKVSRVLRLLYRENSVLVTAETPVRIAVLESFRPKLRPDSELFKFKATSNLDVESEIYWVKLVGNSSKNCFIELINVVIPE